MGEQEPEPSSKVIKKLGAGGALLALCNNCEEVIEKSFKISYENPDYIKLIIQRDENQKPDKDKKKRKQIHSYISGVSIGELHKFVYKNRPNQEGYTNLEQRLKTLCKRGIVDRFKGKERGYSYRLHVEEAAFSKILILLAEEAMVHQLVFTDYFKEFGRDYLQAIYKAIPEGLLDVDPTDEKQVELYIILLFDRYLKSPTFRKIFLSENVAERMTLLQDALNASYLRNQSVKNRFPFLQTLGTYCIIIDALKGDKKGKVSLPLSLAELAECLNDVDRAISRHIELNEKQTEVTIKGLHSREWTEKREQLLKSRKYSLHKSTSTRRSRRAK